MKTGYLVAFVFLGAFGCSQRPEGYVAAGGVVKKPDGTSLNIRDVMVRFDPYDPSLVDDGTLAPNIPTQGTRCKGWLANDGRFTLKTHTVGRWAELGNYKVYLVLMHPDEDGAKVPQKYQRFDSTPWTAEITVDGENEFEFVVVD